MSSIKFVCLYDVIKLLSGCFLVYVADCKYLLLYTRSVVS